MNMLQKTVWITGASSGIGEALAKLLDKMGYHIIVTARNADKLTKLAASGQHIDVLSADLSTTQGIDKISQYFSDRVVDIAIINAGTCEYMNNAALDSATMKRVFDINFFAAAESIHAVIPALTRSSCGHLVGVSSMSVCLPFSRAEYYASSKAALSYYLQSLAIDIKHLGIDVTTVYPGFVETPLTDKNDFSMPFIITAEEAAQHFLKVLKKKPRMYAFPTKMHFILSLLRKFPSFWFNKQTKTISYQGKEAI